MRKKKLKKQIEFIEYITIGLTIGLIVSYILSIHVINGICIGISFGVLLQKIQEYCCCNDCISCCEYMFERDFDSTIQLYWSSICHIDFL